jgi:dihydroxyacetone kinase DhaKLM complex PTS-EIIA-like component DhaM
MLGILVVSHSADAARGIRDIALGMAGGEEVLISGVGGSGGELGVSVSDIFDALTDMLPRTDGVLIVPDIGSSLLSSASAIGLLRPADAARVMVADAPALEGAMMAAVEASAGSGLEAVAAAAAEAWSIRKGEH